MDTDCIDVKATIQRKREKMKTFIKISEVNYILFVNSSIFLSFSIFLTLVNQNVKLVLTNENVSGQ